MIGKSFSVAILSCRAKLQWKLETNLQFVFSAKRIKTLKYSPRKKLQNTSLAKKKIQKKEKLVLRDLLKANGFLNQNSNLQITTSEHKIDNYFEEDLNPTPKSFPCLYVTVQSS